ncbi:MAG: methyltransferase [Renibacterium salmoninarum]|nr:methyltransferase [Renibacterium salmoninarum]
MTKLQSKMHDQAEQLLTKSVLTHEEKLFVIDHWQESANNLNSLSGAFFTPYSYAADFALEVTGRRIIDLCAGIGTLSYAVMMKQDWAPHLTKSDLELTCVELNADYVRIGQKILPEAQWIQANVFELLALKDYDFAIANPPFGRVHRDGVGPRFIGAEFEYHLIDLAAEYAPEGAFILPQGSSPFTYSGMPYLKENRHGGYSKFHAQTGIVLEAGLGIETTVYAEQWHGVNVRTEVVRADLSSAFRKHSGQRAS